MKNISSLLLISCYKATELIEKKSIAGLTASETVRLHIHSSMCGACRMYSEHSALIDRMLSSRQRNIVSDKSVDNLIAVIRKKI